MTKPSRFGEGRGKNARFGKGVPLPPRTPDGVVSIMDFSGGYNSSKGREGAPPNSSPDTIDFEVNRTNKLVRMAGTQAPVALVGHKPYQMATQVALDGTFELVYFDAPYIGVRKGSDIVWTNVGLVPSPRPFAFAQYADTLYFSNLTGQTFKRDHDSAAVAVPSVPAALSYGTFAARFFALGTNIEGAFQPMGVRWSAASGDPDDFDGDGAGAELLIADITDGEHGVAVRAMSLDLLALVCTGSVWVGRRTGDTFRPAAFEPRTTGIGGLTDRTCTITPLGVAFLSKDGLQLFDGNSLTMFSGQINAELLPLDIENILAYRLSYDQFKNRIELLTPSCRWVYDVQFNRWYRGSLIATDAAIFADEVTGIEWAQLVGAWSGMSGLTWLDLSDQASNTVERHYLKPQAGTDSLYAVEDPTSTSQFGLEMLSRWQTSRQLGQHLRSLQTVKTIDLEYSSQGVIEFYLPGKDGMPELAQAVRLYNSNDLRTRGIPLMHTGRGVDLEFRVRSGQPVISTLQMVVEPRSQAFIPAETSGDALPFGVVSPTYLDPVDRGYTRISHGFYSIGKPYSARIPQLQDFYYDWLNNLESVFVQGTGTVQYSEAPEPAGFFKAYSGIIFAEVAGKTGWFATKRDDGITSFLAGGLVHVFTTDPDTTSTVWMEYYNGRIRAWGDGNLMRDAAYAHPALFRVCGYGAASDNPDNEITGNKRFTIGSSIIMRRRDLELEDIPAGGHVMVSLGGSPAVRVDPDVNGKGTFILVNGQFYPTSAKYDYYDATNTLIASLLIPVSYGGDVIGYVSLLDIP